MVEYKYWTGHITDVLESLNRSIGQYKSHYSTVKIGITGRDPQIRFNEHKRDKGWERMIVLYKTSSIYNANQIEALLINQHFYDIVNQRSGGGSDLSPYGDNYLYVLLM